MGAVVMRRTGCRGNTAERVHDACTQAPAPTLQQVYREALATRHYTRRTVYAYERWLRRFLRFHRMRHPREMGGPEINAFLTHLAVEEQISASSQNQALSGGIALSLQACAEDPPRRSLDSGSKTSQIILK